MNRRSARNRHRRDPFPLPIEHMVAIRYSPDHIERTVTVGPDNFYRAIRPSDPVIERIGKALDGMTITAVDEKNGTVTVR